MKPLCYLNGSIVPVEEAKVGVYDLGLLRGFGIYEGLITHNRVPFALADHLVRFHRSAEAMRLTIPTRDADIERTLLELIAHNVPARKEGLIRIILTGGAALDGIAHDPKTPTFYMLVEEHVPLEKRYLAEGGAVAVFEHQRQFSEFKTTNYIQAVLLQETKREKNVIEVLYTSRGHVLEATGSNFFIVQDGALVTPKDDILLGITRKVVLDLARPHIPLEERTVSVEEMYLADEAFITGSFKEVVPIVKIDDKKIGSGAPGPVTKKVLALFQAYTRNYRGEKSATPREAVAPNVLA